MTSVTIDSWTLSPWNQRKDCEVTQFFCKYSVWNIIAQILKNSLNLTGPHRESVFFQDFKYISVDVIEFHIKLDDCFFAIIATCGIQAFHVLTATFLRMSLFLMVLGDTLYSEARDFIDSPFLYLWIYGIKIVLEFPLHFWQTHLSESCNSLCFLMVWIADRYPYGVV